MRTLWKLLKQTKTKTKLYLKRVTFDSCRNWKTCGPLDCPHLIGDSFYIELEFRHVDY